MNVRPFCIALLGLSLAAPMPAAALDARDLMGSWYASGLTATTAEQDPTILELFLTVNLDGTIDLSNEATGEDDQSYAVSYDQCFHPRTATSNSTEADEDDTADEQTILQTLVTGGALQVSSAGVVSGTIQLDAGAQQSLGYDTIVIDDFRMNSTAELITGVTNLSADRVMHMNIVRLPVDEDAITVPCLFDDCDVDPAPTATLTSLTVAVGDSVAQGDALATVEGDLTETITAPADGLVGQVNYAAGATVEFGQTLLVVESPATTVSTTILGQPTGQFAEGSWAIAGYFETIQDNGQEFSYVVDAPPTGPASWEIVSLNVGIGNAITQGQTVARLVSTDGQTTEDVLAPSSGIITEVYQQRSDIVLPDLGGQETFLVPDLFGLPYKVLCFGERNGIETYAAQAPPLFVSDVFDFSGTCLTELEVGDDVQPGDVLATLQLSCCSGSPLVEIVATEAGYIKDFAVEGPCFPQYTPPPPDTFAQLVPGAVVTGRGTPPPPTGSVVGWNPPPSPASCSDSLAAFTPIMIEEPYATIVQLDVSTNQPVYAAGDPLATAVATVSQSRPNAVSHDIFASADGWVTEIYFNQWSDDVKYGSTLISTRNLEPRSEIVEAGETLFVANEDPTCHPNFSSNYEIRATSMGLCESATITSVGVSPGDSLCGGDVGLVAYEYSCPNPDNTSGPPINEVINDFAAQGDSVVESVSVSVGDTVVRGDLLLTLARGASTQAGSINGEVRVYPGNTLEPNGLTSPHTGQLQTSTVEFTDSCTLQMANNVSSSSQRVSRSLKGQPSGEFNFSPDPGGDWYFQISRDRNFAIGNSVGFYLGGNFRHQNMIMVKGPQEAIHIPSLGLGNPDGTLTSLHGLEASDYLPFPPTPGSTVSVGDPLATLTYTPSSGDPVDHILRSPVDGYVGAIYDEEGDTVAYDETLMTLLSSPTYPTPPNQPAETTWEIRGFTDEAAVLAGATRSGTLSVNADGDQLTGGSLESSDGSPPQTVTGGAVELVISTANPLDNFPQPETTTGVALFGTPGEPMTFAGSGVEEQENLMLSFQRDVIAGVTEDTNGVTGFVVGMVSVGMVPEPSARLLVLAALGALGAMRWRLRGRR